MKRKSKFQSINIDKIFEYERNRFFSPIIIYPSELSIEINYIIQIELKIHKIFQA